MIVIIFISLLLANALIVIMHKSSKVIAFMLWLSMLFIYAGNIRTGFSDLPSYRVRYETGTSSMFFSDLGYVKLADFFGNSGYSFQFFLAIIFLISSICMFIVIKKLNANYNVFVCLLAIFYMFFAMEVIRFFIALAIAVLGIFYICDGKLKGRIIYVVAIIIGALFHKTILMLLPFVFIYRLGGFDKKVLKVLFYLLGIFSIGLIVLNLSTHNSGVYLERFFSLLGEDTISLYKANFYILNQKRVRFGFIFYFIYYFMNLLMSWSVGRIYTKSNMEKTKFADMVHQYNIYSMVYLPFIMISTTFFRPILFGCVISFATIAELYGNREIYIHWRSERDVEWIYITLAIIVWTIIWWYLKINAIGPIDALRQNMFF